MITQNLKKFLTKNIVKKELKDKLAVADAKLGGIIKEKLEIKCIADSGAMEVMRGIRLQLDSLLEGSKQHADHEHARTHICTVCYLLFTLFDTVADHQRRRQCGLIV